MAEMGRSRCGVSGWRGSRCRSTSASVLQMFPSTMTGKLPVSTRPQSRTQAEHLNRIEVEPGPGAQWNSAAWSIAHLVKVPAGWPVSRSM